MHDEEGYKQLFKIKETRKEVIISNVLYITFYFYHFCFTSGITLQSYHLFY